MTKSSKPSMFLIIGFFICLGGCTLFAFLGIDRSISLAYQDDSYEKDLGYKRLLHLLESEWVGMPEQELLSKLESASTEKQNEKIVIFKDEQTNVIVFDTLEFELESGRLKRIK